GLPLCGGAPVCAARPSGRVAGPNGSGTVTVTHSTTLWGFDGNLRRNLWCGELLYVDALVGYRQLGLDESLSINESLFARAGSGLPPGTPLTVHDRFAVQNRFYGGQLGVPSRLPRPG